MILESVSNLKKYFLKNYIFDKIKKIFLKI